MDSDQQLRLRLRSAGYDDAAISAVWPPWWSAEAAASTSAQAELRFTVAKKLGLDPRHLLEDDEPRFIWKGESKFKHLRGETDWQKEAIGAFGIAVGRALSRANSTIRSIVGVEAAEIRELLIKGTSYIGLGDLLAFCWGIGIPVIHLRVFPLKQKRMSAMCVKTLTGFAILIARDSQYPAQIAFYIAHEIAHIALGHLDSSSAVLDFADGDEDAPNKDEEEREADNYALELLTGMPHLKVESNVAKFNSAQLADAVLRSGPSLKIDPGILALCCGHTTGRWPIAMAALAKIHPEPIAVWREVNKVAEIEVDWEKLSNSNRAFIHAVMGLIE